MHGQSFLPRAGTDGFAVPQPFSRRDRRRPRHPRVSSLEERASQGRKPAQLPGGLIEIDAVDVIELGDITVGDARSAGYESLDELLAWLGSRDGMIHRVAFHFAGADPRIALRNRSDLDEDEVTKIKARLARFDLGEGGPWTVAVLEVIRDRPGVRAPDLAASFGRETQPFKRDVRKLKELGLTESLEVGYRLSPRGRAFLEML